MCTIGKFSTKKVTVMANGRLLVEGTTDYKSKGSFELVLDKFPRIKVDKVKDSYWEGYDRLEGEARISGNEIHIVTDGFKLKLDLSHYPHVIEAMASGGEEAIKKLSEKLPNFGVAMEKALKGQVHLPPPAEKTFKPEVGNVEVNPVLVHAKVRA